MQVSEKIELPKQQYKRIEVAHKQDLAQLARSSWTKIAPFWPLQNLIAVNPLAGFLELPFLEALRQGEAYFQQSELPKEMESVNLHSIKWLQAYFDYGQATIKMPKHDAGFMATIVSLLSFDNKVVDNVKKRAWLALLPNEPLAVISDCLKFLNIAEQDHELFLTLMITTLPGWAAHVKYLTNWSKENTTESSFTITEIEYLAVRLLLTSLLWPNAKDLLSWHNHALKKSDPGKAYKNICATENAYLGKLLPLLKSPAPIANRELIRAQLVFCIDVRSESFRRALENQSGYATYGFAGFFGLPISVYDQINDANYASCPVLLKPAHKITNIPQCQNSGIYAGKKTLEILKQAYKSLKYNFTSPFALVESLGLLDGIWMAFKSLSPRFANLCKATIYSLLAQNYRLKPMVNTISLEQQIKYAVNALRMMGLTDKFAPIIMFVGHGSSTENNAYATSLDCGACGGRHGAPNAMLLAEILNNLQVRSALISHNIQIPTNTYFLGAEHNTTTDEVEIYDYAAPAHVKKQLVDIKQDLHQARAENCLRRAAKLGESVTINNAISKMDLRSTDWAQVRPEWGLARNAAFIIGPRALSQHCDLDGRAFLHSYDWNIDHDQAILSTILTAPVIVAQWINSQYLFSSLDNVAFGGGSKVTKNITGKFAVMQGNASDLMTGLPLQSVYLDDDNPYHESIRLTVIIYAPKAYVEFVIKQHKILQDLFGNEWLKLICIEPAMQQFYRLGKEFDWVSI